MMAAMAGIGGKPDGTWWQRRVVRPVLDELGKGMSVRRVAWTISLGVVLGVFPIMGSTTILCLMVGWLLKLNQAILQIFNLLLYPLHLALILVFIRLGERLYGAPLTTFSIPELVGKFKDSPLQFGRDFGMAAWHGISAWLVIAPLAAWLITLAVFPLVKKLAVEIARRKEIAR